MPRAAVAWILGLVPSAAVLVVCRILDVDSDIIAAVLVMPLGPAAWLGGRRAGQRIGAAIGVGYAVALLAPFGHVRIGLTRDMLVLAVFVALGRVIGALGDRQRPALPSPVDNDPTALLNAVSHDLRNPLSTIRAASTDLRDGVHIDDAVRRSELLDLVCSETDRLDRLVGNLLHAGRARAGRLVADCGPESLGHVVASAIERLTQVHRRRIVNDVPSDLPPVHIDPTLIDQVIANLVDNSARVSPPDTAIRIAAVHVGDMVAVTVTDAGPGFPQPTADPFEAYVSTAGSSGLGLTICRSIVHAHGGTIELVPVTVGAAVRFTVPVADID